MPIYEFECNDCDIVIEKQMKMTDNDYPVCPKCNKDTKKIMSQTSFSLKGDGWFRDGYQRTGLPDKNGET